MSKDAIREQLDAMPVGPKRELAEYMNKVYEDEADAGWAIVGDDYRYDLLDAPTWVPPQNGEFTWSDASAITESAHNNLVRLREQAAGWFYLKDGKLIFVTVEEWKKIKSGRREP